MRQLWGIPRIYHLLPPTIFTILYGAMNRPPISQSQEGKQVDGQVNLKTLEKQCVIGCYLCPISLSLEVQQTPYKQLTQETVQSKLKQLVIAILNEHGSHQSDQIKNANYDLNEDDSDVKTTSFEPQEPESSMPEADEWDTDAYDQALHWILRFAKSPFQMVIPWNFQIMPLLSASILRQTKWHHPLEKN